MKLRNITLLSGVLLAAALSSCSNDQETPVAGGKVSASFKAGIAPESRAGDVLWDVNDAIGITMLDRRSGAIQAGTHNYRYYTTTAAGDFKPAAPSNIIYFPQDGGEVTFKSYYPYLEGLSEQMAIPVSVADQSDMSRIDLMSAEHLAGFSKDDPNVSLAFHHRLSKVVFKLNIADGVSGLQPEDLNLTIQGMNTSGTYDLRNEALATESGSVAEIALPLRGSSAERTGIVMPRPAGAGVTFTLTSAGGSIFKADMDNDLELKPGYKYIFNITLEGTELSCSVTVEDWIEGPATSYDVLGVTTPVGDSYGVTAGDRMQVYMQNGNAFDDLRVFTYGSDGKWTTPSPVYWDEILNDPVNLKAAMIVPDDVQAQAAGLNQIPDILVATPLSVQRNHGADFVFNHAGSKVTVELASNVFTADELNAATITLPSYFVGGREVRGVFVPGTTRGNITADRSDPDAGFAIIQPQPVSPAAALVRVRIGAKDYTARATDDGFLYEAGVAYKLLVNINESDISVSATVVDWIDGGNQVLDILEVSTSSQPTSGIDVGARMTVYKKGTDNTYSPWTTYTYTGGNRWNPDNAIYWKDIAESSVSLRAGILGAAKLNSTQMDDLLIADDVDVPAHTGVDFTLRHAASKVTVLLLSDVFSAAELNSATVAMPQYLSGGTNDNGQFVPGQAMTDVRLEKSETTGDNGVYYQIALIQPQTIDAENYIFRVTIGGVDYWAKAPADDFTYAPGTSYGITIHINEDGVNVSARVIDWTDQEIALNAFTVGTQLPDASDGVNDGEKMEVYAGNSTTRSLLSSFTYDKAADSWTAASPVFWDDIPGTPSFYAGILRAQKLNDTQLDDYLIAAPLHPDPAAKAPLNFVLKHAAAKVVVQLKSSDGTFSAAELGNMQITLPGYLTEGAYDNGLFDYPDPSATGTIEVAVVRNNATAIIRPQTAIAPRTVVNIHDPATGRDYPVSNSGYGNIDFAAGVATTLVIDMKKTPFDLSANVVDWQTGSTINLVAPSITIGGVLGNTADFFRGKSIQAYIMGGGFKELTCSYAESPVGSGAYSWSPSEMLYWNDFQGQPLNVTGAYYPNGNAPAVNAGVTSFVWNLPTDQSGGYDGYDLLMSNQSVSSPAYVNLSFTHVLSKVRVKLVSDEFTQEDLNNATVVLNNFIVKGSGSLLTGSAIGSATKETVVPQTDADGRECSALIMPQNIPSGTRVVGVTLTGYPGQTFPGVLTSNLTFAAGKETVITINLKKTKVELSATLEPWSDGDKGGITIQ